jgi:hypothetical protein
LLAGLGLVLLYRKVTSRVEGGLLEVLRHFQLLLEKHTVVLEDSALVALYYLRINHPPATTDQPVPVMVMGALEGGKIAPQTL